MTDPAETAAASAPTLDPPKGLPEGAIFAGRLRWHRSELRPSGTLVSQVFPAPLVAAARAKDQHITFLSRVGDSAEFQKYDNVRLGTSAGKWRISGVTALVKALGLSPDAKYLGLWHVPQPDGRLFLLPSSGEGGPGNGAGSGAAAGSQAGEEPGEQPKHRKAHKRQLRQERNRQLRQRRSEGPEDEEPQAEAGAGAEAGAEAEPGAESQPEAEAAVEAEAETAVEVEPEEGAKGEAGSAPEAVAEVDPAVADVGQEEAAVLESGGKEVEEVGAGAEVEAEAATVAEGEGPVDEGGDQTGDGVTAD